MVRLAARVPDDNALAAGRLGSLDDLLGLRVRAVRVVTTTAGATTVELDAVALTGDAEALARAVGRRARGAGDGAGWRGASGAAAGGQGWDVRVVAVVVAVGIGLRERGGAQGAGDVLDGRAWLLGLGRDDAGWGQSTAVGNGLAGAAGLGLGVDGELGLGRAGSGDWDIEDVELAACGGLGCEWASWVVRDVVAVHDVLLS